MKKTLVLMRHGQTLFNEKKRIQGACDSPLTSLGIAQAKNSAKYIQNLHIDFDHAYSSPSERACDTLELVTDMPYERIKGLREFNFGKYEGEPEYLNPPIEDYDWFFKKNGGESRDEVRERMTKTLRDLMNNPEVKNVFVTSHGGAIMNFIRQWPLKDGLVLTRPVRNCAVFVLEYDDQDQNFIVTDIFNENYTKEDMEREYGA